MAPFVPPFVPVTIGVAGAVVDVFDVKKPLNGFVIAGKIRLTIHRINRTARIVRAMSTSVHPSPSCFVMKIAIVF